MNLWRTLLTVLALVGFALPSPAQDNKPALSALFAGNHYSSGCEYEMAARLHRDGFNVTSVPTWGAQSLGERSLTIEELRKHNVLVLAGIGRANADGTIPPRMQATIDAVRQYMEEGGGVVFIPAWVQIETLIPGQIALVKPYGLELFIHQVPRDPSNEVIATAWEIPFSCTRSIKPSPITRGVKALWYPVSTIAGYQAHTTPIRPDSSWDVLVESSPTCFTIDRSETSGGSAYATREPWPSEPTANTVFKKGFPILATRPVGKGRLAVMTVTPEYMMYNRGWSTLEGVVGERGLNGIASDGYRLLMQTMKWVAEPSTRISGMGGAPQQQSLLKDPYVTEYRPPFDWSKASLNIDNRLAAQGVIGARSSYSGGKYTVEQWAKAARQQGLSYLVFLEEFASMDRAAFDQYKQQCARVSDASFVAIPGFVIYDQVGFAYFYYGTKLLLPKTEYLSTDGTKLVSWDRNVNKKDPRAVPGQLSSTALAFAYTDCGVNLTAGNFLFEKTGVPFANFFSVWDAFSIFSRGNGELVEDGREAYRRLAADGQGPTPIVIDRMDDPAMLAATPWRTVVRVPNQGNIAQHVAKYWDTWRYYPDAYTSAYITAGPRIDHWGFDGPRDYEGAMNGDFVWQNLRWRVRGQIHSDAGLKEVTVYNGPEVLRRYLPNGQKDFSIVLELAHDKQHYLLVEAVDLNGRSAISREQWDRNHRLEEFNCADRMNQLSFGHINNSKNHKIELGGNTTLATPNKRVDVCTIAPAATFKNDRQIGSFAFDGACTGDPDAQVRMHPSSSGVTEHPNVVEARRVLHTGDVNIGEGDFAHLFADNAPAYNVWHSLWRTRPAETYTFHQRRHFFQMDPDQPLAVFLWTQTLKPRKPLSGEIAVANLQSQKAKTWMVRSGEQLFQCDIKDDPASADAITGRLSFESGSYAAMIDSPLGGMAFYPASEGMKLGRTPGRKDGLQIVTSITPEDTQVHADLLIVGIPRTVSRKDAIALVERFQDDFGLGGRAARYRVRAKAGKILQATYPLRVSAAKSHGFDATVRGTLCSSLPIAVSDMNDRWSAVLYDRTLGQARPVGIAEGTAWATIIPNAKTDLFIGHPVVCDKPELFLQVTQTGEEQWSLEVHNPTDNAVQTQVTANRGFDPLLAHPAETVEIPAGSSVKLVW